MLLFWPTSEVPPTQIRETEPSRWHPAAVLSEASRKVQNWLDHLITDVGALEPALPAPDVGPLPWSALSEDDVPWEGCALSQRIFSTHRFAATAFPVSAARRARRAS